MPFMAGEKIMFFTTCGGINFHIFKQYLLSIIMFSIMTAIFILTPTFIGWVNYKILGISEPIGIVQEIVLNWWVVIYFGAFLLIIAKNEWNGYQVASAYEYKPGSRIEIENAYSILVNICNKAGIDVPRLIISERGAHASRSIFFGRMIGLNPRALSLNDDELEAVIAHEVGHLSNRDLIPLILGGSMHTALIKHREVVAWFFGAALFWIWLFTDNPFWHNWAFLVVSSITLLICTVVFIIFTSAFSRNREYLADAAAIKYIGWDKRKNLTDALGSLGASYAFTIFDSHPTYIDRKKALNL